MPDLERVDRIGEFWGYPESRTFAELLIDCEEDRAFGRYWSARCGTPTAASARRIRASVDESWTASFS